MTIDFVNKIIVAVIIVTGSIRGTAQTIYVDPNGSDRWSGRISKPNVNKTDGPLASLNAAGTAVRKLKKLKSFENPITVQIADGAYTIKSPVVFTPEDSGTESAPVIYCAAPGARPVFSGGEKITGFRINSAGIWETKIKNLTPDTFFEQLFVNGRRATRARTPDRGTFEMANVGQEVIRQGNNPRLPEWGRHTVYTKGGDAAELAKLTPQAISNVMMVVYHKWDITRRFLSAEEDEGRKLISEGRGFKAWNPWKKGSRYHLENYKEALTAPGEWFLASDGMLFYKPLAGEKIETAEVIAPQCDTFAVFKGRPEKKEFVEYITLRGLSFEHGAYRTPLTGFEPEQAAASIPAVIMADGARNIHISHCSVSHIGSYGIWFRRGCDDCRITDCTIEDMGAGGIRIGDALIRQNSDEKTSNITVANNTVQSGGRIFPCAIGVWIGQSGSNIISHNTISDLFYTGISVGWTWGYGKSLAKSNLIIFNHIYNIGQGLLSDMGAVYLLGKSEGTIVSDNLIHDVDSFGYGGWGLYTDEGSSGILMERNLVYNVKSGGFHQHYGSKNILRNNIFAFSQLFQLQASRIENHLSFSFEKNIVYYKKGRLLQGPWNRIKIKMDNNCYFNADGKPVLPAGMSLQEWQNSTGHDTNSLVCDPQFMDPDNFDFRLKKPSPVFKLGFKEFDYTKAGVSNIR